ncbi:MAG: ABC transporter permease [Anaerolineales bacterium]|nr:ABC transporter permease [Anaerolineales bacterium]
MWRDIQVRYKQTALGVAWVVLQPLLTSLIFAVIFGGLARLPSDNVPYVVFSLAALVPWNFFAAAFGKGSASLVGSANLISKVYFPRLVIPLATVLAGLVDLAIGLVVLLGAALAFRIAPSAALLALPLFLLLALGAALGVALWLSALNVQFRDVGHLAPFFTQVWFYVTPVVYALSLVPEPWRVWLGLNPLASVAQGFRWAVLGTAAPPAGMLLLSAAVTAALLISGLFVFRRMERTFADVV